MKTVVIAIAAVAVVWLLIQIIRANVGQSRTLTLNDFPALMAALKAAPAKDAFWVVLVPGTAREDGGLANLQYSVEDGAVGLDWVLNAKRNVEDRRLFEAFVAHRGGTIERRSGNGMEWLRAKGVTHLVQAGQDFLKSAYEVTPETQLGLELGGFKWKRRPEPLASAGATRT